MYRSISTQVVKLWNCETLPTINVEKLKDHYKSGANSKVQQYGGERYFFHKGKQCWRP